ncbi:hypothetical protein CISIN_1g0130323mg, partial [Citrus sinensis]
MGSLFQ